MGVLYNVLVTFFNFILEGHMKNYDQEVQAFLIDELSKQLYPLTLKDPCEVDKLWLRVQYSFTETFSRSDRKDMEEMIYAINSAAYLDLFSSLTFEVHDCKTENDEFTVSEKLVGDEARVRVESHFYIPFSIENNRTVTFHIPQKELYKLGRHSFASLMSNNLFNKSKREVNPALFRFMSMLGMKFSMYEDGNKNNYPDDLSDETISLGKLFIVPGSAVPESEDSRCSESHPFILFSSKAEDSSPILINESGEIRLMMHILKYGCTAKVTEYGQIRNVTYSRDRVPLLNDAYIDAQVTIYDCDNEYQYSVSVLLHPEMAEGGSFYTLYSIIPISREEQSNINQGKYYEEDK